MFTRFRKGLGVCALALSAGSICSAEVTTANTPLGAATAGQNVNARATFTTTAGQLAIVLENLQANPRSASQTLSGLSFTLSGGQTGGSLLSSSGMERAISDGGAFADLGTVPTGWGYSNNTLNVLGTQTAPEHLIIGPPAANGMYGNANGSIAGNGPHNPFFALSANFTLNIPGVTANTVVNSVLFRFSTSNGATVPGVPFVPEPASAAVVALGATLLMRRRA